MAAFMSTHDSYLLAWSSIVSQDIIGSTERSDQTIRQTKYFLHASDCRRDRFVLLIWGIWYKLPDSVWTYMGVTGTVYVSGSATALIGGMYWKRASSTGAIWAMCGGLFAIAGLFVEPIQAFAQTLGVSKAPEIISAESIALAVYALCVSFFVAGSVLFPDPPQESPNEGVVT